MATLIDLSQGDVTLNPGDLGGDTFPRIDIVGLGSNTLTLNTTAAVDSISNVEPGSTATFIINRGTLRLGDDYGSEGSFTYDSDQNLAAVNIQFGDAPASMHFHRELAKHIDGPTSVTFGGAKNQTFAYRFSDYEPSPTLHNIDVYGMGANGSIRIGNFVNPGSDVHEYSYDAETSVLRLAHEQDGVVFNIHDVSEKDANLFLANPGRYISEQGIQLPARGAVCFFKGTLITTHQGLVAVEDLEIGDTLPCLNGSRTVKWIGRRTDRVSDLRQVDLEQHLPVRIKAGAITHLVPTRDLIVSPEHHVMISGCLVRACDIVNGTTIAQLTTSDIESIDYFHVELDQFDLVIAHGVYSESWADGGNRSFFQNADVAALRPKDYQRRRALRPGFDHLVLREGKTLEDIQNNVSRRAQLLSEQKTALAKAA